MLGQRPWEELPGQQGRRRVSSFCCFRSAGEPWCRATRPAPTPRALEARATHQSQATPWNPLSCLCSGYANCLLASPKHVSDKGIERVHREASGAWSEEVRLTVVDPTGRREDAG